MPAQQWWVVIILWHDCFLRFPPPITCYQFFDRVKYVADEYHLHIFLQIPYRSRIRGAVRCCCAFGNMLEYNDNAYVLV